MMRTCQELTQDALCTKIRETWPNNHVGVGTFATFTDEEWGSTLDELLEVLSQPERLDHLLEIRVFEHASELHAVRGQMSSLFSWRIAGEDDETRQHLDDVQYLDIDAKYHGPDAHCYKSMSGGTYRLPIEGAERIHVRNYLEFDAEGLAHVVDFRVVELLRKGEVAR